MRNFKLYITILLLFLALSCSSGSSGSDSASGGADEANFDCSGNCSNLRLSASDVELILRQAVKEALANNVTATLAVTDRVGNVLGVYQMAGALASVTIDGQIGAVGGLEGAVVPASFVAITKAGTGAFLSSQGNGFSTRTAGQIIQDHFNPGEDRQPGGPLFGVQFSQTICSDVTNLNSAMNGPRPLPLGLSADPGGIPLYINGDLVGGIGVEVNGLYTFDRIVSDNDDDIEERIALAASVGFEAPSKHTGNRIFVLGKTLRYTDLSYSDLESISSPLPELDQAAIISVPPFFDGSFRDGTTFGEISSGVAKSARAGFPTATLVNTSGAERFPPRTGNSLGGLELTATEVSALLDSAILTAYRSRAAIRRPLDSEARVSIWVVDHLGTPLGFTRSEDAPVFGIDVALQKARTAAFFSSADAGSLLTNAGLGSYVDRARALLGANALTGTHAFADRSGGNLSRPYFPDGIETNAPGPFSLPFPGSPFSEGASRTWSPFNNGLQLDIILSGLVAPLSGVIPTNCASSFGERLKNGIQIFPGSVPLYRGSTLIGGIGVSGDGVDQDDLISFFGASRKGLDAAGHQTIGDTELGFNAPKEIRADTINVNFENIRLRYVNCPEAPFLDTNDQNVCDGL